MNGNNYYDETLQIVHWKDIQTQSYQVRPLEIMLQAGGFIIKQKCLLKGQPRKTGLSQYYNVVYDKDYVIEYLKVKVINSLLITKGELKKLIDKAYL
jgi:hypothetical protein